jgi:hypothetical protein
VEVSIVVVIEAYVAVSGLRGSLKITRLHIGGKGMGSMSTGNFRKLEMHSHKVEFLPDFYEIYFFLIIIRCYERLMG